MDPTVNSPASNSPDLHLDHPTLEECMTIWTNTAASWIDSLTLPIYLEESRFMTTVPLARYGGMTTWILVDRNRAPNERSILSSCETFRKRALTSDASGVVEETIVHGIASVFCAPQHRRRGYAGRLMIELSETLRTWQSEYGRCFGSILYSDVGKTYYAKLGWLPNATNAHLVFQSAAFEWPERARSISEDELADLCRRDEEMVRIALRIPAPDVATRVTILPDLDHMLWHIRKEDFATEYIFGEKPHAKGAIAGRPGKQVWVIWTHRYYKHPKEQSTDNVLYILRLVIEGDTTANKTNSGITALPPQREYVDQAIALKAVIRAAQVEAAHWKLDEINLWEPSPLVRELLANSGLDFTEVERHEESIASGLWYGYEEGLGQAPVWINNEHYAWM